MHPRILSLIRVATLLLSSAIVTQLSSQPSGGPYGPQRQSYELPADAANVYHVAPDGGAEAPGSDLDHPTTLESAIERAATGDVVVLRGGTYRTGNLVLNQGITLQPYADEQPVLKGTRVATEWEALRDHVWRTHWTTLFPQKPADWWRRNREGMRTPLHRFNNDMVFVDGRALQSAGWEGALDADSYSIDYENGYVYLGIDPTDRLVEITAHDAAIVRTTEDVHGRKSDKRGFVIRGITFTQYAYRALEVEGREPEGPADPATFGKDVVGTTLENVTITHCSRVAAYLRGDRTTVRHCRISDTSTEGVYLIASSDSVLEGNIFARNNVEHITGYYPAAVKIFNQTRRVICRNNLVIDQPESNGIWYDVGNVDGVFINNWVENCLDGFFFEISKGAICAGNVFLNCDKGVRALNSCNVRVFHNTFIDSVASFERTERSAVGDHFGWHPATGPDVDEREGHVFVGNLLAADADFPKALLRFDQTETLKGRLTQPQAARIDGNIYVRNQKSDTATHPLIAWAPSPGEDLQVEFETLDTFRHEYPQFESNSRSVAANLDAVFKSPELKRFHLVAPLPVDAAIPDVVLELLGWPKVGRPSAGAYPADH